MKRFVIYTLLFVMLGCAITIGLLADERTRNVNQYYGRCASTETDGPLSAEAYITSDVDYPGEGNGFVDTLKSRLETLIEGYGIEYEAYAKFEGEAPNDEYTGTWEAYAGVPGDDDGDYEPRQNWKNKVKEDVKSKYKNNLHNNPNRWSDAEKGRYGNWNAIQADTDLSACSAWGYIDGSSPEIPGEWVVVEEPSEVSGSEILYWLEWQPGREAESHSAYGNAWNFPDPAEHNNAHN